jgi:aminoglycoside N3'-acetyltransferase
LDWLTHTAGSHVLLMGADFTSLSYGHYLESMAPVPWADYFPWKHLGVEKAGVSVTGEQELRELPGCSKGFKSFEKYLLKQKLILPKERNGLRSYLIPVDMLFREGLDYFRKSPEKLLCGPGSCPACDERWAFYLNILNNKLTEQRS